MQQLTQKLKDGSMQVIEVPEPAVSQGMMLVRNYFSLISAGTEGSTVSTARKSLIGKAKERPQQVKQVVDVVMSQGVTQAYRAVMKKLDAFSPLGYSCAGSVIQVSYDVTEFSVGDFVACGGLTASHAEIVSVPKNLCVKLAPDADIKQAAYNTLGAIALQGIRQANLRLGETCAVIGMGLLGQLACLTLRASGVRVIGVDIVPAMVEIASNNCTDLALVRDNGGVEGKILEFTDGLGCDAVIITAGTDSLDPINFAGAIARKKGTVVVVGAVPTGFDREPHYYRKELQVKMSCSYGPGRYDPQYEEKGIDYPHAYVRWTEKRNMEAFQELIHSKKIDVSYLTTHTFKLEDAPKAYDMMMAKSEPYIGILIEYDVNKPLTKDKIIVLPSSRSPLPSAINVAFIGAGSYAQSHLLPNIPKESGIALKGVMTSTGTSSRSVADRYGFEFCTSNEKNILDNQEINTVFIATRHDSHAQYVLKALQSGKHVFVEKPLCLTESELEEIMNVYAYTCKCVDVSLPLLMVGYNRRFSPLVEIIKKELGDGPMSMIYRINAGAIPADSWIQDPTVGGGRIIGEVCHFVDLLTFLNGSLPVSVHATAMKSAGNLNDTVTITLAFANGSIGSISYFANGDKKLPKEYVEVYSNGVTAVLDDFRTLSVYGSGKKKDKKLMNQDKGQKNEVQVFLRAVKDGHPSPIPFEQIYNTSLVTFKSLESLRSGNAVRL